MNSANVCGQRRKEHHATPMNQTVSKAVFPIRPILSGPSFFFSNPYPKYVPHGFTPRPAPPYYSAAKSKTTNASDKQIHDKIYQDTGNM